MLEHESLKISGLCVGVFRFVAWLLVLPSVASRRDLWVEMHRKPTVIVPAHADQELHDALWMSGICSALLLLSRFARRGLIKQKDTGASPGFWKVLFAGRSLAGFIFGYVLQYGLPK
jgi:hypothetical protein